MTNDDLLKMYRISRAKLEADIINLEEMKENVEKLFPKELTQRNKMYLEDKVRTSTGFYDSILKMRQELHKTIEKEIEMLRKIRQEEESGGNETVDIEELVLMMDEHKKTKGPKKVA